MSETKQKIPLADALAFAEEIVATLRPACARIEIAGSIRRRKAEVGDVELVAISKQMPIFDLFGQLTGTTPLVDDAIAGAGWRILKGGDKYKQLDLGGVTCDLFLPTPETWGMIYTIRTGSADFTHWLVTPRYAGGAMPSDMRCRDGRLWRGGVALDTPEEADVFRSLGLDSVQPEERTGGRWPPNRRLGPSGGGA